MIEGIRRRIRSVLGAPTEYRYTLLKWQPSLRDDELVPVALIAEKAVGEWGIRFVFGQRPDPDRAPSELSRRVVAQLPAWLRTQMQEADESGRDPLSYLAENNPYNLFFTTPTRKRTRSDFFEEALRIFGREILGQENPNPEEILAHLQQDAQDDSPAQLWQPTEGRRPRRGRVRA